MIARVLTTFTAALVLASAAFAQQAQAPRDAVGTTGTAPAAPTAAATPAPPSAATAAAPRGAEAVAVDPKDYRIGPEDILDINVWKNADLSRERVPVRPDGKISHPLINDIDVAG